MRAFDRGSRVAVRRGTVVVVVFAAALGAEWARVGCQHHVERHAGGGSGGMSSSVMAHMERPPKAAWIPYALTPVDARLEGHSHEFGQGTSAPTAVMGTHR